MTLAWIVLATLAGRQNSEGAFGKWADNGDVSDFQTVWAAHFLTEAQALGVALPQGLLENVLPYLQTLADGNPPTLAGLRVQAQAVYVLTRNGVVTSPTPGRWLRWACPSTRPGTTRRSPPSIWRPTPS